MKKTCAVLLIISILLLFGACSVSDDLYSYYPSTETTDNTLQSSGETTEALVEQPVVQLPTVAVSVPTVTHEEKAEDGTVIFRYTTQNISLVGPEPEVADKIILDFLNRADATSVNAETICAAAKKAYKPGNAWSPYLSQITYEPMRIDEGVLSFFGSYTNYTGTPHPETTYPAITYDLTTGNLLQLSDILTDTDISDTLYASVIDALNAQKNEKYLYDGFEDTVKDRFAKDVLRDECWFLSQEGLCFYFSPYEIAPYSSGVIIAQIPYSALAGIMNDAYFPAEQDTSLGDIAANVFNESDLSNFTQFSEVILSDGSKILLHTDKSVYNIRITQGTWSANGTTFTPGHTVFAAYTLTHGDAVMVESAFSEALPTIQLSYDSNGKTVCKYISFGPKSNSVNLIDI